MRDTCNKIKTVKAHIARANTQNTNHHIVSAAASASYLQLLICRQEGSSVVILGYLIIKAYINAKHKIIIEENTC